MALRIVTSAALVGVAAGTINLAISDCGDSATHGKVGSISPSSVPQGTKTLVTGTGSVDTTVADGSYNVNVKALGVSMKTCKADLCGASKCALPAFTGSVDFRGLNCPQAAGDVSLGFDVTVSRTVPSSLAVLSIEITSTGSAGKLICATIQTSPGLGFEQRKTWDSYKQDFQKVYNSDDEDAAHQAQFEINSAHIEEHNSQGESLQLGYNQFTDLTQEQYRRAAGLGFKASAERHGSAPNLGMHPTYAAADLAASVDWTTQGAVTPVKDQGQCGSCWAFSSTGGMEGAWQIASGSLKSLSEQQLVDCSKNGGNAGCNGGDMGAAFDFEKTTDVATEASYPYKGVDGTCSTTGSTAIPAGGITGYTSVGQSTSGLQSALMTGPVSVAIEADQLAFQLYNGGILENSGGLFHSCGENLDHGVLAVGYGDGFFKVKNSWGASWGESGYLQISSAGNTCGIHSDATQPTVSASVSV